MYVYQYVSKMSCAEWRHQSGVTTPLFSPLIGLNDPCSQFFISCCITLNDSKYMSLPNKYHVTFSSARVQHLCVVRFHLISSATVRQACTCFVLLLLFCCVIVIDHATLICLCMFSTGPHAAPVDEDDDVKEGGLR